MNSKFPVTVSAELPGGGQFKLDGNAGPLDKADTALTPLDAKIHVNSLDLARTGFLDPALGLGGLVDMDSTLASKNGSAETKGNLKLSKALLVQGGSPAGVPAVVEFGTRYDLRKKLRHHYSVRGEDRLRRRSPQRQLRIARRRNFRRRQTCWRLDAPQKTSKPSCPQSASISPRGPLSRREPSAPIWI